MIRVNEEKLYTAGPSEFDMCYCDRRFFFAFGFRSYARYVVEKDAFYNGFLGIVSRV